MLVWKKNQMWQLKNFNNYLRMFKLIERLSFLGKIMLLNLLTSKINNNSKLIALIHYINVCNLLKMIYN